MIQKPGYCLNDTRAVSTSNQKARGIGRGHVKNPICILSQFKQTKRAGILAAFRQGLNIFIQPCAAVIAALLGRIYFHSATGH
jgi:hypothetical protein